MRFETIKIEFARAHFVNIALRFMKLECIFPDDILSFSLRTAVPPINVIIKIRTRRVSFTHITPCPAGKYSCTDEKDAMAIFTCFHGSSETYIHKIFKK